MIPASTIAKLATLGLSTDQASAVAEMMAEVEAATEAKAGAAIAARRANDRNRKDRQRHVTSRDITGPHVTARDGADNPTPLSSFPPHPPNNYPPALETHTHTAPGARADAVAGFEPSSADVAALGAEGLGPADVAAEVPPFRDHWLASNDPLPADLGAAFRGFCRHGRGRRKPLRAGQPARASPAPSPALDDGPRVNTPSGPRTVAFLLAQHRANRWSTMFGPKVGEAGCVIAAYLPKTFPDPTMRAAE